MKKPLLLAAVTLGALATHAQVLFDLLLDFGDGGDNAGTGSGGRFGRRRFLGSNCGCHVCDLSLCTAVNHAISVGGRRV